MTLLNWLASANTRNKEKTENTEANMIKRNGPERVAAVEVKAKKMNLASTLYDHASSPLIDMEIVTLMGGMMPIRYSDTVKRLSSRFRDFHVATLDMPTDKLQNFLRGMPKKVIAWNHWDLSAFQFR